MNFLLTGKKHLQKKKAKSKQKNLKDIDNKLNETKECIEKIQEITKPENEKPIF